MKKISDIDGIVKQCRERIIKTMQERGIVTVQFCPTQEDYEHDHENDEEYQDYYDYRYEVCPNVVYFDGDCVGYEYTVLQVTLVEGSREPYFKMECEASELGSDTFIDTDVYDMTWVYEMLEKHLGIEDEPEYVYVFTAEQAWDGEVADTIVRAFPTEEAAQKYMREFINDGDGDDESIAEYVKRKEWVVEEDDPFLYRAFNDGYYNTDHIELTITKCEIKK